MSEDLGLPLVEAVPGHVSVTGLAYVLGRFEESEVPAAAFTEVRAGWLVSADDDLVGEVGGDEELLAFCLDLLGEGGHLVRGDDQSRARTAMVWLRERSLRSLTESRPFAGSPTGDPGTREEWRAPLARLQEEFDAAARRDLLVAVRRALPEAVEVELSAVYETEDGELPFYELHGVRDAAGVEIGGWNEDDSMWRRELDDGVINIAPDIQLVGPRLVLRLDEA